MKLKRKVTETAVRAKDGHDETMPEGGDHAQTGGESAAKTNDSPPRRKLSRKKASVPKNASLMSSLRNRKNKSKDKSGYESSESEGTKALNEQYEKEPHEFVALGSENFLKLPAID